jgi:O-antigen/teichoic acid export membrane protein
VLQPPSPTPSRLPGPEPDEETSSAARSRMQKSAVSGSVWTVIGALVGLPLNFAVNIVVVRLLGPAQFGLLATLLATLTIGLVVLNAGVSDATIQWGAAADAADDRGALLDLARRAAGFHVFVQTPASVALVVVLLRNSGLGVVILAAVGIAVTMILGTSTVVQVAINRTARNAQIVMVTNIALQAAVVVAAVASHDGTAVWASRVAFSALPAVVIIFTLPSDLRTAILRPLFPHHLPRGFSAFAAKALGSALLSTLIYSRSELFVMQYYGLAVGAGIFALAFGLSAQLTVAVDALLQPLVPAAAGLIAADAAAAGSGLLRALRIVSTGTGLVVAVLMPAVAAVLALVYGAQFTPAALLFIPLSVASCLMSANGPVTAFVSGVRRLGTLAMVNLTAFVIDFALAVTLIPELGAWGAVIANFVGQVISVFGSWSIISRALDVRPSDIAWAAFPLLRGVLVGAPVSLVAVVVTGQRYSLVVAALAALAGVVLLAFANRLGPLSLGATETSIIAGVAPRLLRSPVIRSMKLLGLSAIEERMVAVI